MNSSEINKYFQSALLYNVPKKLVNLSYSIDGKMLIVKAIFESEPKQFELDCVYAATQEVLGNFETELESTIRVDTLSSINKANALDFLVFARYDSEEY